MTKNFKPPFLQGSLNNSSNTCIFSMDDYICSYSYCLLSFKKLSSFQHSKIDVDTNSLFQNYNKFIYVHTDTAYCLSKNCPVFNTQK